MFLSQVSAIKNSREKVECARFF